MAVWLMRLYSTSQDQLLLQDSEDGRGTGWIDMVERYTEVKTRTEDQMEEEVYEHLGLSQYIPGTQIACTLK